MLGNHQFEFITCFIQSYPQLPIILVTGAPTLLTLPSAVGPHIASSLIKPFPIDALLACIRTAPHSRPQEQASVVLTVTDDEKGILQSQDANGEPKKRGLGLRRSAEPSPSNRSHTKRQRFSLPFQHHPLVTQQGNGCERKKHQRPSGRWPWPRSPRMLDDLVPTQRDHRYWRGDNRPRSARKPNG